MGGQGKRRCSWLGAALLGFGVVTALPARAWGAPADPDEKPRLNAEVERLARQRNYDEAIALVERALSRREKALGPDHLDVAAALYSLALLYRAKRDYAHAEPLSQRALAIREKALGPDHPD